MWMKTGKPNISWISSQRFDGDEWTTYTKKFIADKEVKSAVFRFETDCTCAIFVNGEFIISGTGRMPERVNCHEVTSKIVKGENTIQMVLGAAYFQEIGFQFKADRGFWLNSAAFELCIEYADGEKVAIPSDASWEAEADGKAVETMETAVVTENEYDMMWKNAAIWLEPQLHKPEIAKEVIDVVGEEYIDYANNPAPSIVSPAAIVETNMIEKDGALVAGELKEDEVPYVIYDFGRLVVGYSEVEYEAANDTEMTFFHDSSEDPADFAVDAARRYRVKKLSVKLPAKADNNKVLNLRRRAFRYLKVAFGENSTGAAIKDVKVRICMMPEVKTGWFKCNDEMLNTAWDMGKYTLQVNKQQEYESCPRNEMQFFSGDGAMDAWIDYYTFGDDTGMMNASLSVKHDERSTGVSFTNKWNRNVIQWDYFAWRVICVYAQYKQTGDKEFLKRYYDECQTVLEWMLERLDKNNLIFQRPCLVSTFNYSLGQTEWTCSCHRIGEKTSMNALLYASLTEMVEMANDMGKKKDAKNWAAIAEKVKTAINERLWSEEKQSYIDDLDDFIAQDANVLAVLFGVADQKRAKAALNTVKEKLWSPYGSTILDSYVPHTRGGNKMIAPFMCGLEARTRFENGLADEAMDLIRRTWGTMLNKGAKTFWEYSPNNDTDKWDTPSHAWAGGCTYLLSAYVMGIKPIKPNYDVLGFEPQVCDLENFKGVVPTAHGFVAASFDKKANKFVLAVPKKIKVEYKLPESATVEIIKY